MDSYDLSGGAELSAATGGKTTRLDPLQNAVSLDAPLTDEKDATLAGFIPDPAAAAKRTYL